MENLSTAVSDIVTELSIELITNQLNADYYKIILFIPNGSSLTFDMPVTIEPSIDQVFAYLLQAVDRTNLSLENSGTTELIYNESLEIRRNFFVLVGKTNFDRLVATQR